MAIRRVLFVDDEDDIRTVGTIALESVGGLEVRAACSGREALEALGTYRPDVIILDVMMPELDGPATLAALRAMAGLATVPVVFLTAKVQRNEVELYRALGAAGVIAKPFDPMTLSEEVRALVEAAGVP